MDEFINVAKTLAKRAADDTSAASAHMFAQAAGVLASISRDLHYMTASTPETPPPITDWRTRVNEEAAELTAKLTKLGDFIASPGFGNLPEYQQELLKVQQGYMSGYVATLAQRLK